MWRGVWVLSVLFCASGCGGPSNPVPRTIRDQVQAEWRCDPQSGELVSSSDTEVTWNVDACGRQVVVRCPRLPDDQLGRCQYGPRTAGGQQVGTTPTARSTPPRSTPPQPTPPQSTPPRSTPPRSTPPQPRPVVSYADDPDAAIRAEIDLRAPAVLECTEGAVTAVDVSWTIDGDIDVELTGRFNGTPTQACAARALADLPIPEGEAGRLRHPIRAR